ncbi:transporter [Lysobacteraceae bacterium NML07-0707]|nr:transporter [Xanthomonadaceae bacterium NML07-0707]
MAVRFHRSRPIPAQQLQKLTPAMNEHTTPTPDTANAAEWFYVDAQRQQQGPLGREQLLAQVQSGLLPADTLVWKNGMSDWQALNTLAELLPAGIPQGAAPLPAQATIAPASTDINHGDIVYAGFWRRVAANVIDSLVVGTLSYIILIPVMLVAGFSLAALAGDIPSGQESTFTWLMLGLYPLLYTLHAIYYGWMQSRPAQATLGKMACGIKVAGNNGERISFWRGFWRYFAFIFVCLFTLGIGLVVAAFTERKRALHDMMCSTLVVDKWAYSPRPELQTRGLDTVSKVVLGIYAVLLVVVFLFAMLATMFALAGQA